MKYYITLLLFLVISSISRGQKADCQCFLKGVIKDQHTGLPLPGATLLLLDKNQGVVTDLRGEYLLSGLCPGKYTIECRMVGYSPFHLEIDLQESHEENIGLAEQEIHLKDIEITAQRSDAPSSQPLDVLKGKALFETRGQTLAESMKGLTGVSTLQTGNSIAKPVIHGLHSNRVLIMNNGVRQEGQQWGSEHAPEIDPFIATQISVIKGAAGVRYGSDAIGGVIRVDMDELPYNSPISGEINTVGLTNGRQGVVSGTVQGSLPKVGLAWRAQGTIKRGGNTKTPDYYLDNTGTKERNFSLSTGYRYKGFGIDAFYSLFDTHIGLFSGSHIGSITDLLQVIENGEPLIQSGFTYLVGRPRQEVRHQLAKVEAHYHFPDGNRLQWTLANQRNDRSEYDLHTPRNDSIAALNHPELAMKLNTLTTDLLWDHKPLAGKFTGQMGISTLYQYNLMTGRPLIPNFNQWTVGLFAMERYTHKQWELEAGVRFDYRNLLTHQFVNQQKVSNEFNFSNFSGTTGANYRFNDQLSAQLNVGTAWRAPNVSELFSDGVHHGAAAYERGDASLGVEMAYNNQLSVQYRSDRLTIELGTYLNRIHNYIYLNPLPDPILTIRGAFPAFQYTQTNASFKGIDLSGLWSFVPALSWSSKATYLRAYDLSNDQYLVMIPPNRIENSIIWKIPPVAGLTDLHLTFGNLWVAQQKRVLPNSDYAPPPPAYSLWNAKLSAELPLSESNKLNISLAVDNLFNTRYRDYMNRLRYYSLELGRQVSIRLKWQFNTQS
ncbi:iron complex outermembrane receptor protein [Dyadobacter jejuensis]|uniref:Iron complex outermembrane receptor protein n=1 Tax=Dyadobacter jejuensis TaxID=1082580 RepID=A0A316ARK1_9BACT|nr:TonB-dependent receptor [Dyadobacter jejuensis]PWJ60345.1 iron complex outermembrane receptor protein [Dyadobacter jejuensis]